MEARLNFFEETVPYAKDGLGSLITVEAVNQLFSIVEESSVTNHASSSDGILGTNNTSRADDPTTVTNATPHHTTVDVPVPAAAVGEAYIAAVPVGLIPPPLIPRPVAPLVVEAEVAPIPA